MNTIAQRSHWLNLIILVSSIAVGIYLRFDRLTSIPPSLSHDESAIAYSAYSLIQTGADEYGNRFPLLFKSFDDYKLPGMVYATMLPALVFGKTELTARLPSAVFGTLALIVMLGIAREVLGTRRFIRLGSIELDGALFPTLMLSVSPWHINFSRQLFESNGAVFWLMLGTYFLLKSRNHYYLIFFSGLCYVVSLYFYYSVRLIIPFICLTYVILNLKTIQKHLVMTIVALSVSFAVFLPMGKEMLSPGGMERISMVSVTNDPNYLKRRDQYVQTLGAAPTLIQKIVYNRRIALIQTILENYGKNISFHNLFVTGTGTFGALYKFELVLIVFGMIYLWSLSPLARGILLVWIGTAFLPGALSINQPNTLRTLAAAPACSLLSGLGILYALQKSSAYRSNIPILLASLVLVSSFAFEFPKFHYAYFIDNPTHNALSFGDGYKQMIAYVNNHEREYDHVYISGYYWRPYIFFLYWGNADPKDYAKNGFREHYGKYDFSASSWDTNGMKFMDPSFDFTKLSTRSKTLFILSSTEYDIHEKKFDKLEEIDGRIARRVFVAARLKP